MTHKETQIGLTLKAQKLPKSMLVIHWDSVSGRESVTRQSFQVDKEVETREIPFNAMLRLLPTDHLTQVQVHKPCLGYAILWRVLQDFTIQT